MREVIYMEFWFEFLSFYLLIFFFFLGTHQELLEKKGVYADLVAHQLSE